MRSRRPVQSVALILAAPLSLATCGGQPSGVTAERVSPAAISYPVNRSRGNEIAAAKRTQI